MLSVVTGLAFECRFCSLLFFLEVFFVRLRLDIFPVTVPPLRLEGRRENKEDPEAFIEAPEHDIVRSQHDYLTDEDTRHQIFLLF